MRFELQAAFILHRRPFRNTSLLIEAFTLRQGRVALVARGASRPKSRLHSILQPFTPLLMSWTEHSELGTLNAAEERHAAYTIAAERLLSGFYLNELVLRLLLRHDPYPELFAAYEQALQGLVLASNEEVILRHFEKTLLDQIGYGLPLNTDSLSGEPIRADRYYCYDSQQGLRLVTEAALPASPMPATISGKALLALRENRLHELDAPDQLKQLKYMMRVAIGIHLDKPLRSREIMSKLHLQRQHHEQHP